MEFEDNLDTDPMFKPDFDNDRSVFTCSADFTELIMFMMRYQDSNYVIAKSIELAGKAFGVTDPSKYPSLSAVYRMRAEVGQKCLDEHEAKMKGIQCLKVYWFTSYSEKILTIEHFMVPYSAFWSHFIVYMK